MKKKLSIVDIASNLGISKTIVSFILAGKAGEKKISEDVVLEVLSYVKQVGYKPNSIAQSLRTGRSYTIALLIEDIADPYFAQIAKLIEDKAIANGYKISYASAGNDLCKMRKLIEMMRAQNIDGYILSSFEGVETAVNELINDGQPVVVIGKQLSGLAADYVCTDDFMGAYKSCIHLFAQGCRDIAFTTFDTGRTSIQERLSGYLAAIKDFSFNPYFVNIDCDNDPDIIVEKLRVQLLKQTNIDAVLFADKHIGLSGLKAMEHLNKTSNNNPAVMCLDDHPLYDLTSPTITAMAQPVENIAANAISILLEKLNKKCDVNNCQSIILESKLIARGSTPLKIKLESA